MDTSFTDLVGQDPVSCFALINITTTANKSFQSNFALDFAVEGPDVLENFDFDSFLHNTDDNNMVDFMSGLGNDGTEAGAE